MTLNSDLDQAESTQEDVDLEIAEVDAIFDKIVQELSDEKETLKTELDALLLQFDALVGPAKAAAYLKMAEAEYRLKKLDEAIAALMRMKETSTAIYDPLRDGQLMQTKAMTAAQAFYSIAMLPGWQKWKPTYRFGTITTLDVSSNIADVDLFLTESTQQAIDINQTATTLIDVPIDYMTCHAHAFEVGIEVVVEFAGQEYEEPVVVGFKDNPKPCQEIEVAIIRFRTYEKPDDDVYMIVDLFNGELLPLVSPVPEMDGDVETYPELAQPFEENTEEELTITSVSLKNNLKVITPSLESLKQEKMDYLYFPKHGYPNNEFRGTISQYMDYYTIGWGGIDPECYEVTDSWVYQEIEEAGYKPFTGSLDPDDDTPLNIPAFAAFKTEMNCSFVIGYGVPFVDFWATATWEGRLICILPPETNRQPLNFVTEFKKRHIKDGESLSVSVTDASGTETLNYERVETSFSTLSDIEYMKPRFSAQGYYNPTTHSATYLEGCSLLVEEEDPTPDYRGGYWDLHYWLQYLENPNEPATELEQCLDIVALANNGDYTIDDGDIWYMALEVKTVSR